MANEWYRRKVWAKDDENEFFAKLKRSRTNFHRSQYLFIQALTLVETKKSKLIDVAERLLNIYLTEYHDEYFHKSSVYNMLGDIYKAKKNETKAIEFYKLSVEEDIKSKTHTYSYINYSESVVRNKKVEQYDFVVKILKEKLEEGCIIFPIHFYKIYTILAILSKIKNNIEEATEYINLSRKYSEMETSGLRYHKYLGIVKKDDKNFLKQYIK